MFCRNVTNVQYSHDLYGLLNSWANGFTRTCEGRPWLTQSFTRGVSPNRTDVLEDASHLYACLTWKFPTSFQNDLFVNKLWTNVQYGDLLRYATFLRLWTCCCSLEHPPSLGEKEVGRLKFYSSFLLLFLLWISLQQNIIIKINFLDSSCCFL